MFECPFCGPIISDDILDYPQVVLIEEPIVVLGGEQTTIKFFYVQCQQCEARGPLSESATKAQKRWGRASPTNCSVPCKHWNTLEYLIVDAITGWGEHFKVDTSCVNKLHKHPLWQQITSLLNQLHFKDLPNE